MRFDPHAFLAQLGGGDVPPPDPAPRVAQVARVARPEARQPALRVASVATVAVPLSDRARARAAALPSSSPTCAACGVADWMVAVTEKDGRTLHVSCMRTEEGRGRT